MDIPVRQLECCSGDLADLKVKSCDIEAWSPRQQKYFEVCSCSNLGDAQARRLKIRVKGEDGQKYLPHTLNNTVVAPPRMLIAFLENNLQADGTRAHPRGIAALHGRQGRHPLTAIQRRTGLGACPFLLEKNEKRSSPAAGELLGKRLWKVFRVCAKTCGKHVGRLKKPRKYAGKVFHRFFSPC